MTEIVARKISQSDNFKESVRYVLRQGRHADKAPPVTWGVIGLNPDEQNADRLAWEQHQTALHADRLKELAGIPAKQRNKRIKTPVLHRLISYPPDYVPTHDEICADVFSHVQALGLEHQETVWACHNDNGHHHVHLIISKVDPRTGLAVKMDDDFKKADAWRAAWMKAHPVILASQDNETTATPPSAKNRAEWADRRLIERETFAEAARALHGQLNAAQRDELRALCKLKAAEWRTTAQEQTREPERETWARCYKEHRQFNEPRSVYVKGYWTTDSTLKASRRGKLYVTNRKRYVRGYKTAVRASWSERRAWLKANRHRFAAAGLEPPTFWQTAFLGRFVAVLERLHTFEKKAAKDDRKAKMRGIVESLKRAELAELKRRHRNQHDGITKDQIRDTAEVLMQSRHMPPKVAPAKTYRSSPRGRDIKR